MEGDVFVSDPGAAPVGWVARAAAYLALTKPRIVELLLITTLPAMLVAAGGWPGTWLAAATLIGGSLSAGGANAINSYLDRHVDEMMRRTSRRPLPTHKVDPVSALVFGVTLGVAGFGLLAVAVNLLAAALATGALLFYVFVYTIGLKRATVQNIVIGGAAGGAPALVGWAAVTGRLGLAPWLMFAIVFLWTPPHFWALALHYREDYARAGIPMLPSVAGEEVTVRMMAIYTGLTVLLTLVLAPVAGLGIVYLVGAIGLGAWFTASVVRLWLDVGRAMAVFRASTIYLAALFAVMVVDVAVGL